MYTLYMETKKEIKMTKERASEMYQVLCEKLFDGVSLTYKERADFSLLREMKKAGIIWNYLKLNSTTLRLELFLQKTDRKSGKNILEMFTKFTGFVLIVWYNKFLAVRETW